MTISALDLFKIGVGPSSSHTVGPMRAAWTFAEQLRAAGWLGAVQRVQVRLYGSLSATGIGHGTDRATVAGLLGEQPDRVDPDAMAQAVDAVRLDGRLRLAGEREDLAVGARPGDVHHRARREREACRNEREAGDLHAGNRTR